MKAFPTVRRINTLAGFPTESGWVATDGILEAVGPDPDTALHELVLMRDELRRVVNELDDD